MATPKNKKAGRPRVRIGAEVIARLPDNGMLGVFGKIIGVPYCTMYAWVEKGLPAEVFCDPNSGLRSYVLKKEKFIRWLQATGRCEI
jgi:hypothetical protein